MRFIKKRQGNDPWEVVWEDLGKENFLCMTDDERKADLIVSAMSYVVERSPSYGSFLDNVRDPEG